MPNKYEDVKRFFERIASLEARVENLMTWQRWQMGILAAILLAALKLLVTR